MQGLFFLAWSKLLRVLQELDDLAQLLLGLVHPGHVGERDGRFVARDHAGPGPAEGHGLVVAALGLAKEVVHEAADQEEQDQVGDQDLEPVAPAVGRDEAERHVVRVQLLGQLIIGSVTQMDLVLGALLVGGDGVAAFDLD